MIIILVLVLVLMSLILGQAHWRKIQELGLSTEYVSNGKVRTFVWKILSMSHVPLGRHPEALRHLQAQLQWFQDAADQSPEDHLLYRMLQQYYDYFNAVWMEGRYHPSEWNYFERDNNTTTNAAESTNWRFQVIQNPKVFINFYKCLASLRRAEESRMYMCQLRP